jgi:nitrite reductase/ring-hydroxylating ferredoxin subunit
MNGLAWLALVQLWVGGLRGIFSKTLHQGVNVTTVGDRVVAAELLRDTSQVPFRITDDTYIPADRYTSREFHNLERERLWPRMWQLACREEDLPRIGDFMEYTIMDYSILVVRTQSGGVKAFHNACRHRGTQLGRGRGSFPTGRIVCPFHGWQWNLDGENTFVYSRQGFAPECLECSEIDLTPVQVAQRWGMVWINMDLSAASFEESLGEITEYIDPLRLDLMRVRWWKQIHLQANWKVAQEAFFEGYHVMQSHPEIAMFVEGDRFKMDGMTNDDGFTGLPGLGHWAHHSIARSAPRPNVEGYSAAEFMIAANRAMWVGAEAAITERAFQIQEELLASGVPTDDKFGVLLMEKVYEDAAARNVPLPAWTPKTTGWAHVFPHFTIGAAGFGSALVYRSRPDGNDPHACIYDFWSIDIPASGEERPRPTQCSDEFFQRMFVVQEDKGNIERQQVGLRAQGYTKNRLARSYEKSISLFHLRLDQILSEVPSH